MSELKDLDSKEFVATLDMLKKIDFLNGIPDDALNGLLFSLQIQNFGKNKSILFQGEIANRLFILRQGSVVITSKSKGQKVTLAELKSPQYFGEISLLNPMSATATVTSGEEGSELLVLSHEAMNDLARKYPEIKKRIQQIVQDRLQKKKQATEADNPEDNES